MRTNSEYLTRRDTQRVAYLRRRAADLERKLSEARQSLNRELDHTDEHADLPPELPWDELHWGVQEPHDARGGLRALGFSGLKAAVSDSKPTENMSANEGASSSPSQAASRTVFVVHGRDQSIKSQVARVLERLQFETIILEERPNRGQTVIEKFQQNSLHVAFALVLMTADDRGAGPGETLPKEANRARQNVILELGYFMGTLGRDRVAALIAPGVEQPSDILGIAYIPMDGDNWKARLAQELDAAGLNVDFNLLYR